MTGGHLKSEDICRWMAGERTADQERHVRECRLCAAEVARLESALKQYGGAVRELSAAQPGAQSAGAWRVDRAARQWGMRRLRWSMAAAALVVLAVIPAWKGAHDRRVAEESDRADAILMEQVAAQVSRTVPRTLEPLLNPVVWETIPAGAEAAQGAPGKKQGDEQ